MYPGNRLLSLALTLVLLCGAFFFLMLLVDLVVCTFNERVMLPFVHLILKNLGAICLIFWQFSTSCPVMSQISIDRE